MIDRIWLATGCFALFFLGIINQVSAESDITIPQPFIERDGKVSMCLLRAETTVINCPQEPNFHDKIQDDRRISVSKICTVVKSTVANPSPTNEYYVLLFDQRDKKWIAREIISCEQNREQVVGRSAIRTYAGDACSQRDSCIQIQRQLAKLGHYRGAPDGLPGPATTRAIEAFQRQRLFEVTGQLTAEQMNELLSGPQVTSQQFAGAISTKMKAIRSLAEAGMSPGLSCFGSCPNRFQQILGLAESIEGDLQQLPTVVQQASTPAEPLKATNERCLRIDPAPGASNGETIVVVEDRAMIFRLIKAPQDGEVLIGLPPSVSQALHVRAGEMFVDPTRPRPVNLNKAVPETVRRVTDFKLQTGLIDPELFKKLVKADPKVGALDPRQVSYNQAREFVDGINITCNGKASFRLPKEEELTYVLMSIYYPNSMDGHIRPNELKSCSTLQKPEIALRNVFADLAGMYWQLTDSTCEKFHPASPAPSCNGGKVIKGGTEQSSADECLPQFRGEVSSAVTNPRTSFRLVLDN
jgi:hypothetical protein